MRDRICPNCQGQAYHLGSLGSLAHYRCKDCGIQFSIQPKAEVKRQAKARRQAIKSKQELQNGE